MDRRKQIIVGGVVVGLVAAGVLWLVQARAAAARQTPAWTDPGQPPEGTAGMPVAAPTAAAEWGAARPGHPGMRAGSRVLRHYPSTLVDDPESVVR